MNFDQIIRHFISAYFIPAIKSVIREELKKLSYDTHRSDDEDGLLSAKESADFIGDALPTFYGRTVTYQ